jgi:lipoprotein-releasing system permease protein
VNYELLIARRIVFAGKDKSMISRPIVKIGVASVALGFAVMILALAIVTGFKKEIREKVIGFGSHIQISKYDENNSYETNPIDRREASVQQLKLIPGVKHIEVFATKAGIIKTKDEIQGVVAKGVGSDFDWSYFKNKITEGTFFTVNDSVKSDAMVVSKNIAKKLNLHPGDDLLMYFIQKPPRVRKFKITGIYETGLEEFDALYVFCDIGHIQKLNDWSPYQVGGFEITINDFDKLDETGEKVYSSIGSDLNAKTIREIYPQLFDWLNLQDVNGIIIIVLMLIVAGINMISALIIIILERVNMIGILKSLGAVNFSIRKIFIYVASFLIGRGLLWGNITGIGLVIIQKYFHPIHLDQQSYYISYVPVNVSALYFILLNAGTLLVCVAMMILPTLIITKISPLKALRFS